MQIILNQDLIKKQADYRTQARIIIQVSALNYKGFLYRLIGLIIVYSVR